MGLWEESGLHLSKNDKEVMAFVEEI